MFNFEIIIRPRTAYEVKKEQDYRIDTISVSNIMLLNSDSVHPTPWLNKKYVNFWSGRFNMDTGEQEIDVEGVMVIKVKGFPHFPKLFPSKNRANNRISITKIRKTKVLNNLKKEI